MTDASDDDLMLRAGDGDRTAFALLVERHGARVMAIAGRMSGNTMDAEEIVQEAFVRAWNKAPDWDARDDRPGGAAFSTWLYRVVMNLCIDRGRRPKARPLEDAGEVADTRPSGYDHAVRRETADRVAAAVAALPERQRAALVLCYYQHMSNAEAARVLGIGIKALEALLVRGRRQLKTALADLQG